LHGSHRRTQRQNFEQKITEITKVGVVDRVETRAPCFPWKSFSFEEILWCSSREPRLPQGSNGIGARSRAQRKSDRANAVPPPPRTLRGFRTRHKRTQRQNFEQKITEITKVGAVDRFETRAPCFPWKSLSFEEIFWCSSREPRLPQGSDGLGARSRAQRKSDRADAVLPRPGFCAPLEREHMHTKPKVSF
jgi:hypothetical protein